LNKGDGRVNGGTLDDLGRGIFASGFPKVPPTVVVCGFACTAPIITTTSPTGEVKIPISCMIVNCSAPVRTIGDATRASPARMIPTPTIAIDRFMATYGPS
jgi:hypothetical protein